MTRAGLSQIEAAILGYIECYIEKHGHSPSLHEIRRSGVCTGMATIHRAIHALVKRGYMVADFNENGRLVKNSLAITVKPEGAAIKIVLAPDLKYIRHEITAGNVAVKIETDSSK